MTQKLQSLQFAPSRPIDEERVEELVSRLSFTLPPSYVDFLRRYGGGDFETLMWCQVVEPNTRSRPPDGACLLDRFLDDEEDGLEWWWKSQKHLLDAGYAPIAEGAGGSLYCIAADGSITYYNGDDSTLSRAAESFEDLIDRLEPDEE